MTKDEITFLMNNGFTLSDIMTMQKPADPKPEEKKPEEQKPADPKPEEKKPEEKKPEEKKPEEQKPNETDSLKAEIAELKRLIQQQNIRHAQQPHAEPERTIDDIFNELINPKKDEKEK